MEHRIEDHLVQGWIRNYKPHPVRSVIWRYLDIDQAQRSKRARGLNDLRSAGH
jgi:hypothetical protein